ncbi:MAG: hypothetical protein Q7K35_02490 [bacterium]|nr:hypothetical protein [bacterium]
MNYKIAQFIITPAQRAQSALEIYVSQPDANKESLAGKLFALIEVESTKAASLKIINFLINSLNYNYYQNEKMILRERVSTVKIEHIFESALAKTNKKLAEFLQTEKIKINSDSLNITIGVVYNDCLHFANLGKNKALLIYRGKPGDSVKYKLADITEQTGSSESKKPSSAVKLFSNIVSGSLPRGGYFIFANETFGEYLSTKQIISITTTLPPAGAAEQIKNTLSKINAYVPFLGIIIKNTAGLEMEEIKVKEPVASTKASIENLIVTEEETEKLLTPSGLINAKKWSASLGSLINRLIPGRTTKANRPAFSIKDKIFIKRKTDWLSFEKIINFLKKTFSYLVGLSVYIFKIATNKRALTNLFNNFILKTKDFGITLKTSGFRAFFWYKNLSKINKAFFSIFLICLLIFSANLGWQNLKNKATEKQAVITNLTAAIEQKQNQIDANLLYNNEASVGKLLLEVSELLRQLPRNNQNQKDQYQELAAKYQVQIEKISHVVRVNPIELANFINLNPSAKPANIILTKGKIYAADAAPSAIYSIDLGSKSTTLINLNNQSLNRLDFPNIDKNNNVYYLNSNKAALFDIKSEKLSNLDINYNGDLSKIVAFQQYNNRFYLTDAATGQIYRFTKTGNQLTGPTPWLNAKEDLTKAVSLDIDGEVYLLKNNGEVSKYAKGKKQDFVLSAVEPALASASKIIVSPEGNYIYILDPLNKRLAVFDKAGKFNSQYTSDRFDNLKDFQIDEKNKKIYFLNNTIVYSVDMVHLVQ